MYTGKEGQI